MTEEIKYNKLRPCMENVCIGTISQTIMENTDIDFRTSMRISEEIFDRLNDHFMIIRPSDEYEIVRKKRG